MTSWASSGGLAAEHLDAQLRELPVATRLGPFVAITPLAVEDPDGFLPCLGPVLVVFFLDDGRDFGNQADLASALVIELVHLAENFLAGFVHEHLRFAQGWNEVSGDEDRPEGYRRPECTGERRRRSKCEYHES
jgi:hypothetical protein